MGFTRDQMTDWLSACLHGTLDASDLEMKPDDFNDHVDGDLSCVADIIEMELDEGETFDTWLANLDDDGFKRFTNRQDVEDVLTERVNRSEYVLQPAKTTTLTWNGKRSDTDTEQVEVAVEVTWRPKNITETLGIPDATFLWEDTPPVEFLGDTADTLKLEFAPERVTGHTQDIFFPYLAEDDAALDEGDFTVKPLTENDPPVTIPVTEFLLSGGHRTEATLTA